MTLIGRIGGEDWTKRNIVNYIVVKRMKAVSQNIILKINKKIEHKNI